jgi:hypothetical protein
MGHSIRLLVLVQVNVAFVTAFQLGGAFGPGGVGYLIDTAGPAAFVTAIWITPAGLMCVTFARIILRRKR